MSDRDTALCVGDDETVTVGDYRTAIAGHCGKAIAGFFGTAIVGDYGTAIAGPYGTAIAENNGKVQAGPGGIIMIRWIHKKDLCLHVTAGHIGKDGIEADTLYECDMKGNLVKVEV